MRKSEIMARSGNLLSIFQIFTENCKISLFLNQKVNIARSWLAIIFSHQNVFNSMLVHLV